MAHYENQIYKNENQIYKKKILVVDTDEEILNLLYHDLSDEYRVTIAGTATEAISALKKERFSAAILAYQLPNVSGIELAEELKSSVGDMCIILMNGRLSTSGLERKVIDEVLKKPDVRDVPTLRKEFVPDLREVLRKCAELCRN